jgi:PAS domain S-box-containing protein
VNVPPGSTAEDATRLLRCLNDLVSIIALPALWTGGEPPRIIDTLLDALVGMLDAAFVFARVNDSKGGPAIEGGRVAKSWEGTLRTREIGKALDESLGDAAQNWPPVTRVRIGGALLSVASARLGLHGDIGTVIVGSERIDFPRQTERLILDGAANQTAIALLQARLLSEQRRVAADLDEHVAQRTTELAAANDELKKEIAERQRSEHALRANELNFQLTVDSIPGMVHTMTAAGGVEFVNHQILDYFGKTIEELNDWGELVHPDDRARVIDLWTRSVATGQPFDADHRVLRADGTYGWLHSRGLPLRDINGNIVRWYNLLTDIDERKRAEQELRRSEARKAAILDSALDCVVTIDNEGCITEFNPAAERTFGYRRDEVLGRQLADVIIPPALREKHRQGFARYLTTGEARVLGRRIEMTAVRADGSEFPVELAITRIPLDGPPSFTGYLRDITERKRAEEGLRRSEAFLAEGQRLARIGNFLWHLGTGDISWSEQVYRMFEFEPGTRVTLELIGSRVHPDDLLMLYDMVERAQRGESYFEYQHRLVMPDNSVKHLHLIAHAVRAEQGGLEYIGAVQDVTKRTLAEEALNKARSELAHVARVATVSTLTASIAHEINQPLSGIITNASTCLRMLDATPPDIDGARETARRTIRDGNRASDVVTRLRALFSKKEFTLELLDLNDATREVIALSSSDLQRNRIVLQSELADDLLRVTGDRIQLQQVILNLLRNASDAMVDVHDRPRQLLVKTEREDGRRIRVSVRDCGVGLPPQILSSLFDAFYTTKRGGMGIGLFVSRSIVESHQGRLWAEPNDGPGATFSFSIPSQTT